jgi:hypothetical protein
MLVGCELDCLLARIQNGIPLAPQIRAIIEEILKQNEIDQRVRIMD